MVERRLFGGWQCIRFEHPHPYIPLAFFHLKAEFDLPGGDGGVHAILGFITAELKYVLTDRCLQEFPVHRMFCTSSYESWLEVPSLTAGNHLPNAFALGQRLRRESSKPEEMRVHASVSGWDVEISTRYALPGLELKLFDGPDLHAAYTDAKSLHCHQAEKCCESVAS
eukprot:6455123-Amphidinium_carterae.1